MSTNKIHTAGKFNILKPVDPYISNENNVSNVNLKSKFTSHISSQNLLIWPKLLGGNYFKVTALGGGGISYLLFFVSCIHLCYSLRYK